MAGGIYAEENGVYQIDCTKAVWATDQVHSEYQTVGNILCDSDFVAETEECIYLIEYKNANIPNAANPTGFEPSLQKKIENVTHKFYDTLHYLNMLNKNKPVKYIYIAEYPNADSFSRKSLCEKIKKLLPFELQQGKPKALIENFDVVSIDEWNQHTEYSQFPLTQI